LRFCHRSFVETTAALDTSVVIGYLNHYER
jgi:hypothetical protein